MPYVFGDYTLDTQRYELRRRGTRLPLRPKVFQMLVYLIEQRHRVVTRDEVLAQVWPNQCVGDETLTSCVKAARRAVGDSGRTQRVIQTVHRRGLRFVAEATTVSGPPAPPIAPPQALILTSTGSPPAVVGREAELTTLHQWYATARQGRRQVGFIAGAAGMGKTALVETFVAQIETEAAVRIGHGQCIEQYGTGEAYLPILEALGRLCRGPEGVHVLTWLRQHAPSWLAQMPALLPDAEREALQRQGREITQARMLRECVEALEVLAAERPLVLIFEDVHWGDRATLEWLAYVARRRDPARLLVLATYRPTEARLGACPLYPSTRELLVHDQVAELVLEGLSAPAVSTYLSQHFGAGELAATLGPVLYQRTQGHPLFLVTMVAELVQRGVVREATSGWKLTASPPAVTVGVPENLRQVIEQQFERLPPAEQALVEAASVAGVDFAAAAVAASLGEASEVIDARCAALARQGQFVQAHGTEVWPDGTVAGRYRFGHALYQDVIYARVPLGRRAYLHRQIGWRLEAGYGPQASEIAAELAMHFLHGHDNVRAVQYLQQAGANAMRRWAHQEAMAYLTRGLELLETQPDTPGRAQQELDLQLALGPALMAARGWAAPEVEQTYARARVLCTQVRHTPKLFPTLHGLWRFYRSRGALPAALVLGEELYRLAQCEAAPTPLLTAHDALGQTFFYLGDYAAAWTHFAQGISLIDPPVQQARALHPGIAPGVACLAYAAPVLWALGYPVQALQRCQEALALAQEVEHPQSQGLVHHLAAYLYHRRRELSAVQAHAEAALTLATAHGLPLYVGLASHLRGWAVAMQGQREAGMAQMHQGLAGLLATGQALAQPFCLVRMAEAAGYTGHVDQGLHLLAEALVAFEASGRGDMLTEAYRLQGEFLLHQAVPDAVQAEACFLQALALARQQQARSWELRAAMSLARLWQHQGKRAEAYELLAPIYGWFTEGFDTADLQEAKAVLETVTR
jgi:DNA-binding winged helix-turn-helix (wHTH) protein/predicted ATPase